MPSEPVEFSWPGWEPDTDEPTHVAAQGRPYATITHPSGECAWCDAERWRTVTRVATADVMEAVNLLEWI